MDLHVPQELVQILFLSLLKLLVVRNLWLLNLDGKGRIAKLLISINLSEFLWSALNRKLRDRRVFEINHLVCHEEKERDRYKLDS